MRIVDPSHRGPASVCCGAVLTLAALLAHVGCQSNAPEPIEPTADASPQAKFDRVVAELRRKLEPGIDSGGGRYTFSDTLGAGTAQVSYEVSAPEKITEPTQPGELPRATIRIMQRSTYSSLNSSKSDEDDDQAGSGDKDSGLTSEDLPESLDDMGFEVLDPSMVDKDLAEATAPRIRAPDISTRTFSADTEAVYELVFENDRWRMAKPPAADAPDSTNIALELALKRQS